MYLCFLSPKNKINSIISGTSTLYISEKHTIKYNSIHPYHIYLYTSSAIFFNSLHTPCPILFSRACSRFCHHLSYGRNNHNMTFTLYETLSKKTLNSSMPHTITFKHVFQPGKNCICPFVHRSLPAVCRENGKPGFTKPCLLVWP